MSNSAKRFHCQIIVGLALITLVNGYSRGAPTTACYGMVPGHYGPSSKLPSPFRVLANNTTVTAGQEVEVVIATLPEKHEFFRGYFVQARTKGGSKILGTFVEPGEKGEYVNCGQGYQSAVTHKDRSRKQRAVLKWKAPLDFEGEIIFRASFVEDYSTFWTEVDSTPIHVVQTTPVVKPVQVTTAVPSEITPKVLTDAPVTTSGKSVIVLVTGDPRMSRGSRIYGLREADILKLQQKLNLEAETDSIFGNIEITTNVMTLLNSLESHYKIDILTCIANNDEMKWTVRIHNL